MATPHLSHDGSEALHWRTDRSARVSQDGAELVHWRSDRDARITQDGLEVLYTDTDIVAEMRVSQLVVEVLFEITVPPEPTAAVVTTGCPQIMGVVAGFRPEGSAAGRAVQGAAAVMRPTVPCE